MKSKYQIMVSKYDVERTRPYDSHELLGRHDCLGRLTQARLRITCPFCETKVDAFRWSLCGSGKKCSGCGALHGGLGTMPLRESEDSNG